jgi:hypothetical protein
MKKKMVLNDKNSETLWDWNKREGNYFFNWRLQCGLECGTVDASSEDGMFLFNTKFMENCLKLTQEGIVLIYTKENDDDDDPRGDEEISAVVLK